MRSPLFFVFFPKKLIFEVSREALSFLGVIFEVSDFERFLLRLVLAFWEDFRDVFLRNSDRAKTVFFRFVHVQCTCTFCESEVGYAIVF